MTTAVGISSQAARRPRPGVRKASSSEPTRHSYGSHPDQFCEFYKAAGQMQVGTVALLHGGFWRAEFNLLRHRPLAEDLARRGWNVWNVEYRRVGAESGWPDTLIDVASAIDAIAGLDVDSSRVVAIGHSAGGQLAAWAAGRSKLPSSAPGANPLVELTAVVSQAGVLDLCDAATAGVGDGAVQAFLGGGPEEVSDRYTCADPCARVPLAIPVVCLHSRADLAVPFSQSETYVATDNAAGGHAELVEVTGDHLSHRDPMSPAWAAVLCRLPRLMSSRGVQRV